MSPRTALLLIVVLIAAIALVAWARRRARKVYLTKLLPDDAQVSGFDSDRLRRLSRTLAQAIDETGKSLPKHDRELLHNALWHAMLLMAGADREIDDVEIDSVAKLYGDLVSNAPDHESVAESIELAGKDRSTSLVEIGKASGVSSEAKTLVFHGAYLVSVANKELDPGEVALLQEIASVLKLDINEIDRLE